MAIYPYGALDQQPDRIRPQSRTGAEMPLPFNGVEDSPLALRRIANLPGVLGIIDPATLRTVDGLGQTMRDVTGRAVYVDTVGGSTLSTKGSGRVINLSGTASFRPSNTGIVLTQDRWSAVFVMSPDVAYTGIGFLFSKIVADANEGRPDFSIGMNNVKICEFDHSPGVTSNIISPKVWSAGEWAVVAISQSTRWGMSVSINGVLSHQVPTANAGLSPVVAERMFQVGNYGTTPSSLGFHGQLGWSVFIGEDYHAPGYENSLDIMVDVSGNYFAI